MNDPLATLSAAVRSAAQAVAPGIEVAPVLERPPRAEFGDYSTNVALLMARSVGRSPREVAADVAAELAREMGETLERAEVAGPGFVNLFLGDSWFAGAPAAVLADGFARGSAEQPERILVEFVSANPTGPLTVASGRHAAFGDALARVLEAAGHRVEREYYVNDHGSQVQRLGESMRARARGKEVPEDGYQGEYVAGLVDPARAADEGVALAELASEGVAVLLERIESTLLRFGVRFDSWFSERTVYGEGGALEAGLARLREEGAVYEHEGALWLRISSAGEEPDRVLRRGSGEHTYFAADLAYHQDKRARGYDRLIDVWGADHHGYVPRMRAAWEMLGGDPGAFEVIILQFVHLVDSGGRASMSKRRGEFVTLDDLMEEIGVDAARWFLVARAPETTVDLDLALARSHSSENPVYYVQYAHARIASMLGRAGAARVTEALGSAVPGAALHPSERALSKRLLAFPGEVAEAAQRRAPHRIAAYALELAQEFTAFYRDCRVVGAEPASLEAWRIALSEATRRVIARSLDLVGVSAPESM